MPDHWLALLPPIIVFILGLATRRVHLALTCGILTAALIVIPSSPYRALMLAAHYFWDNLEINLYGSWSTLVTAKNSFICFFLCMLGVIVTLIGHSGGTYAYGVFVKNRLKNNFMVEIASLLLSSSLVVDDYFSALTVGSVMHPLTDQYKIPRIKLAFLINSMASPLAILAPISSWAAALIGFLGENGVSRIATSQTLILDDPFVVYTRIFPFLFYSFIIIGTAWFIVVRRISFGPMAHQEKIAIESGNLYGGKEERHYRIRGAHIRNKERVSMIDFFVPTIALFLFIFFGIQYTGGSFLFGGSLSILDAFRHANPYQSLMLAGIMTLCICIIFYLMRNKLTLSELPGIFAEGVTIMLSAIMILMLSWTLGDILRNDLHTGSYLANIILGFASIKFLPFMLFIFSAGISLAIGTSWGTAAIMFPIAIPMVVSILGSNPPIMLDHATILLPVLGATLCGSIAGDHISPISDTTNMSSTSAGAHHIDHVHSQMIYSLPAFIGTACAFLVAGFLATQGAAVMVIASLLVGFSVCFGMLTILNSLHKRDMPHNN